MKKVIVFLGLCVGLAFSSYGTEKFSSLKTNETMVVDTDPTTWQEQLEYAKNKANARSLATSDFDKLYLEGYEHRGTINSESEKREVIERIFADTSYMARQNGSHIDILRIGDIRSAAMQQGDDAFDKWLENAKTLFTAQLPLGIEVIGLRWNYKGSIYHSVALASNEYGGVMYENIGYAVIDPNSPHETHTSNTKGH